jgi:hypothetical protein
MDDDFSRKKKTQEEEETKKNFSPLCVSLLGKREKRV